MKGPLAALAVPGQQVIQSLRVQTSFGLRMSGLVHACNTDLPL